jgi:hypothetical protein
VGSYYIVKYQIGKFYLFLAIEEDAK